MPCIKCNNGKWKYGQHGRCQFDTLETCKAAAAAIHAKNTLPNKVIKGCSGCESCKKDKLCNQLSQ